MNILKSNIEKMYSFYTFFLKGKTHLVDLITASEYTGKILDTSERKEFS